MLGNRRRCASNPGVNASSSSRPSRARSSASSESTAAASDPTAAATPDSLMCSILPNRTNHASRIAILNKVKHGYRSMNLC
jgi:hypothetical protein